MSKRSEVALYGPSEFNPSGVWYDMLSAHFPTAKVAAVPRVREIPVLYLGVGLLLSLMLSTATIPAW